MEPLRQSEGTENPAIDELHREHWRVPVHGLSSTDPGGTVHVIARPDGTVTLHVSCGGSQAEVQLDVCRAAQLSTGIWEAAGTAQRLTPSVGDQPAPPQPPPDGSGDLPDAWRLPTRRSAHPRDHTPKPRRKLTSGNQNGATDAARTIGVRIRRIRTARDKSLRVTAGLAGMSHSTLHRVEHGQREPTLSEIVALANALQIDPAKLIALPILASVPN